MTNQLALVRRTSARRTGGTTFSVQHLAFLFQISGDCLVKVAAAEVVGKQEAPPESGSVVWGREEFESAKVASERVYISVSPGEEHGRLLTGSL